MGIQLARAKAEGIIYKLIEGGLQPSTWKANKRLCHIFSLVVAKMHAATIIHFRCQDVNQNLQEHIQKFTDLLIVVTGIDPKAVTSQVTNCIIH